MPEPLTFKPLTLQHDMQSAFVSARAYLGRRLVMSFVRKLPSRSRDKICSAFSCCPLEIAASPAVPQSILFT